MNRFPDEKVRILIVDDEELSTETLKLLLENILTSDYKIDVLYSGDEVVQEIQNNGYHIVFLDNKLPGKDGLSILKEIKARNIDTNIIFLTGYSDEETAVKAMKLDAKDYIPKGNLDVQRLLEAINGIILESCFTLDIPPAVLSKLQKAFSTETALSTRQTLNQEFVGHFTNNEDITEALELLYNHRCLDRKWIYSTTLCPECGSPGDEFYLACQVCGSKKLVKGEVIEHHKCGHVDFKNSFLDEAGRFVCPKCGEKLNQIGVDYARVGTSYKCDDNHIMSVPEHVYRCSECGEEFTEDMGELIKVYRYEITEKGRLSIDICDVVKDQENLDNVEDYPTVTA